jgi:hypothetical protein
MRYIPISKFFSQEFVDVAPGAATTDEHLADALIAEIENERQSLFEAGIAEERRALRKWDIL